MKEAFNRTPLVHPQSNLDFQNNYCVCRSCESEIKRDELVRVTERDDIQLQSYLVDVKELIG